MQLLDLPFLLASLWPAGYELSQSRAGFQSLVAVLHAAATARGQPTVLSPAELAAYSSALGARSVAARMALAAELTGDAAEAAFWRRLPATLCALQSTLEAGGSAAAATAQPGAAVPRGAVAVASRAAPSGRRLLWEEGLELAEALERSGWHEQMSRRIFEGSEDLQASLDMALPSDGILMPSTCVCVPSCPAVLRKTSAVPYTPTGLPFHPVHVAAAFRTCGLAPGSCCRKSGC